MTPEEEKEAAVQKVKQQEAVAERVKQQEAVAAAKLAEQQKIDEARTTYIDSLNLRKEFSENEIKAEEKYKGKILVITTQVRSVDADGDDRAKIWTGLLGSSEFVAKTSRGEAAPLDAGQIITLKCESVKANVYPSGDCSVIKTGKIEPFGLSSALQKALKTVK